MFSPKTYPITNSSSTPFGVLPYPKSAYPIPLSNFSSSEESDIEDSLIEDVDYPSSKIPPSFHLGPATWNPKELEEAKKRRQLTMPDTLAPAAKMPTRNHHSAPKFDSKPASLSPFLDEVEQLAQSCALTGKQKIEWEI